MKGTFEFEWDYKMLIEWETDHDGSLDWQVLEILNLDEYEFEPDEPLPTVNDVACSEACRERIYDKALQELEARIEAMNEYF